MKGCHRAQWGSLAIVVPRHAVGYDATHEERTEQLSRKETRIDANEQDRAPDGGGQQARLVESVCFLVAGRPMAIPIEQVSEAVEPPTITPMFHLPRWVRGLAPLRGDILLVLDLAALIDLPSQESPQTRVLVVRAEEKRWGVIVDEIMGVRRLSKTTTGTRRIPGIPTWAMGLFADEKEPVLLLDMNRLAEQVGAMGHIQQTARSPSGGDNGD